ncbi:MAG: hypothetical protein IJ489_08230 [Clostridia bacterium]|nr:hypothetical protein [Clostridia bacterium]
MKKILSLLLSIIFVITCFIGCNTANKDVKTGDTSIEKISSTTMLNETSSTAWIRDESKQASYLSELGVATQTVHYNTDDSISASSSENNIKYRTWEPLIGHDWQYTPDYETESSEDFDFEITYILPNGEITDEDGRYNIMPDQIVFTIRNKTGKPFKMIGSPLLECYRNFVLSGRGGWTRAPYYDREANEKGETVFENGEGIYVFDLKECQPYDDIIYEYYDGGRYRVIFYLNDGPHYVTFIADGPPET